MESHKIYEHLLGIPNLRIDKIEEEEKKLIFHCHIESESEPCPSCRKACSSVNQTTNTKIRDLWISEKEVYLNLSKRQFYCKDCNFYFTERLSWASSCSTYTNRLAAFIFGINKNQSFYSLAAELNIGCKTLERMFYKRVESEVNIKENWSKVRHLGIDEISNRKGRGNYCCVLTNLETGEEIDILPDRKFETIQAYFKKLGLENCPQIELICSDMWDAYANVAKTIFPNAIHVIDRYHVVKLLNEGLDNARKEARREMKDCEELKHIKWALFKRIEDCSEEELIQLDLAFEKAPKLLQAYLFRNAFNAYMDQAPDALWLEKQLKHWEQLIKLSRLTSYNSFLKTLSNWMHPIANFAKKRVTNAATEGLNNIIRQVKRMSYGMYNFDNLRLRVLGRNI